MTNAEAVLIIIVSFAALLLGAMAIQTYIFPRDIYEYFKKQRELEAKEATKSKQLEKEQQEYEEFENWLKSKRGSPSSTKAPADSPDSSVWPE